jgi:hypothetical protein
MRGRRTLTLRSLGRHLLFPHRLLPQPQNQPARVPPLALHQAGPRLRAQRRSVHPGRLRRPPIPGCSSRRPRLAAVMTPGDGNACRPAHAGASNAYSDSLLPPSRQTAPHSARYAQTHRVSPPASRLACALAGLRAIVPPGLVPHS